MSKATLVSSVVKPTFISVVMDEGGKLVPHRLNSTHPTFSKLAFALRRKNYGRVPLLLDMASEIANQSHGHILVKKEGIYYKNRLIESALSRKVVELMAHKQPVAIYLKFMENLYMNPSVDAQNELFEWLLNFNGGKFVPTDDGCFMAYKVVNSDYTDCHTGKVLNKPGCRPLMARTEVDPDRHNECSRGYHFCSLSYVGVFSGWTRSVERPVMAVKINPADVVAIPEGYGYSKGRTWTYEVIRELEDFPKEGDHEYMQQVFVPVAGGMTEKGDILKALYALPNVKKLLKRRKLTKTSLRKASTDRLRRWYGQFNAMVNPPDISLLFQNPLKPAREAAKLSVGEVAAECDVPYKVIYNAEHADTPNPELQDAIIRAIATLKGTRTHAGCSHVSYPEPAKPVGYQSEVVEADTDVRDQGGYDGLYVDPFGYEVEDAEDED